MNVKNKLTFFYFWEESLWDDKVEANKYFGTVCILLAAVFGALTGGGNTLKAIFHFDTEMSMTAAIAMCIFLWGLNIGESIVASTNALTALLRSLLMLVCLGVSFFLGHLMAVVVIIVVSLFIVIYVLVSLVFGGSGSGYLVDENGNKTKVMDGFFGQKVDYSGNTYDKGLDGKYTLNN